MASKTYNGVKFCKEPKTIIVVDEWFNSSIQSGLKTKVERLEIVMNYMDNNLYDSGKGIQVFVASLKVLLFTVFGSQNGLNNQQTLR